MTINQDIEDAIKKNLPSQVSEQLQKVLAQGALAIEHVATMSKQIDQLRAKGRQQEDLDSKAAEQVVRQNALDIRDRKLAISEAVQEARVEMHKAFMAQYNLMWAQTFSSPEGKKLAFEMFGTLCGQGSNGMNTSNSLTLNGSVGEQKEP